jgi:fatty-acid desaturase
MFCPHLRCAVCCLFSSVPLQYFGGFSALVWMYSMPFVIVETMTLGLNTICHLWGSRPYDTGTGQDCSGARSC